MARRHLYPEGLVLMNVSVPSTVRDGLTLAAERNRQSRSQLVAVILEDWLKRRGDLPEPELVGA